MTADYYQPEPPAWLDEAQESPASLARIPGDFETCESSETRSPMRVRSALNLHPSAPTKWLARGHLPKGAVSVLVGDEGIGKSLWWVLIVAYITTGRPLPLLGLHPGAPSDVLLVLTEDSWTGDVRPRLELAGADLSRVFVICEDEDGSGSPLFPRDMSLVYEAAAGRSLALVVVDAWLDTVHSGQQVKDPQQARAALHPWKEAATRTGAAVLLLAHTNRADTSDSRNRVGATGALRQKARVLLYAAAPPDSEGRFYLGADKANGTARGQALAYVIDVVKVREATPDDPGTVPRLRLEGQTGASIRDHLAAWHAEVRRAERPSADDRLTEWLRPQLEAGEPLLAEEVKANAATAGHSPKRVPGVVQSLGWVVGPLAKGGPWYYRPPQDSQVSEDLKSSQTRASLADESWPGVATS